VADGIHREIGNRQGRPTFLLWKELGVVGDFLRLGHTREGRHEAPDCAPCGLFAEQRMYLLESSQQSKSDVDYAFPLALRKLFWVY